MIKIYIQEKISPWLHVPSHEDYFCSHRGKLQFPFVESLSDVQCGLSAVPAGARHWASAPPSLTGD